jgi:hypothetical protein
VQFRRSIEAFRLNGYRMPKETEDQIKLKPVSLDADAYQRMWPRASGMGDPDSG